MTERSPASTSWPARALPGLLAAVLATLLATLLAPLPARAQMRLEGLERVYFERVAAPDERIDEVRIAALLPASLDDASGLTVTPRQTGGGTGVALRYRDVRLPGSFKGRRVWIREVVQGSELRTHSLWWALYDDGQRSDVWRFDAVGERNEDKVLPNYRLDGVYARNLRSVTLRIQSDASRPGGAWQLTGKEWTFVVDDKAITLTEVRNDFHFARPADADRVPAPLIVSIERELGRIYEQREVDVVRKDALLACGFNDASPPRAWSGLDAAARCITRGGDARVGIRPKELPSFAERGGELNRTRGR